MCSLEDVEDFGDMGDPAGLYALVFMLTEACESDEWVQHE